MKTESLTFLSATWKMGERGERIDVKEERPAYFIKDGLAVARPCGRDDVWMIGHVMTGMSFGPFRWRSKVKAKAALLEMIPLTDWNDPRFKKNNAFFLGKPVYEQIKVIALKHLPNVDANGDSVS